MADFDLTQTDAQVQSILNDAQDAMGAGAQTSLTTDYIMLKGTNGRYHKILKDSFTEAVRNVLAGLLVNNDKGTTISQIPAIASGDFGSVTPANLASVLGGTYFVSAFGGSANLYSVITVQRWNTFVFAHSTGVYMFVPSSSDTPVLRFVGGGGSTVSVKFYFKRSGDNFELFITHPSGYSSLVSLSGQPLQFAQSSESVSSLTELTPV